MKSSNVLTILVFAWASVASTASLTTAETQKLLRSWGLHEGFGSHFEKHNYDGFVLSTLTKGLIDEEFESNTPIQRHVLWERIKSWRETQGTPNKRMLAAKPGPSDGKTAPADGKDNEKSEKAVEFMDNKKKLPNTDAYKGLFLKHDSSKITMGKSNDIQLLRLPGGGLTVVAPNINFISQSISFNGQSMVKLEAPKLVKPAPFDSRHCKEITVKGAGLKAVDGVYSLVTDIKKNPLPNGGDHLFPYWCMDGDCKKSIFNQWGCDNREGSTVKLVLQDCPNFKKGIGEYGWGIQLESHHRYYNNKIRWMIDPLTIVRSGYNSVKPIPKITCTDYQPRIKKVQPTPFDSRLCAELEVKGAGLKAVDGIYYVSSDALPNGGFKHYPYFCVQEGCKKSIFNQWGSSYGWGMQLDLHHRYYNKKETFTIDPLTIIRNGHSSVKPIPKVTCTDYGKWSARKDPPFSAKRCWQITVKGAGMAGVDGVYERVRVSKLPNGGSQDYPYYCVKAGCATSIFNQWGDKTFGYGIQYKLHHRYSNKLVSDTITEFNGPPRMATGATPKFWCSKYAEY